MAPGEAVAVTATDLAPGAWTVFLSKDDFAGRPCLGPLARSSARSGEPTVFSGTLPTTIACPEQGIPGEAAQIPPPPPAPKQPGGPTPVKPGGGYRLVVCVADDEGSDCEQVPADRVGVHVVPAGAPCDTAGRRVTNLRARNVTCTVATRVARGSRDGDLRYRRARMACRGVRDDGTATYRCVRAGARVTFTAR